MTLSLDLKTPQPVTILWRRSDGAALTSGRHRDDGAGMLVITGARMEDAGRYVCQASDGVDVFTSEVVLDIVHGGPGEQVGIFFSL